MKRKQVIRLCIAVIFVLLYLSLIIYSSWVDLSTKKEVNLFRSFSSVALCALFAALFMSLNHIKQLFTKRPKRINILYLVTFIVTLAAMLIYRYKAVYLTTFTFGLTLVLNFYSLLHICETKDK